MKMKRIATIAFSLLVAAAALTACDRDYVTYSEGERIQFVDTLQTYPVTVDGEGLSVRVASTIKCDYDRTFGIEVVDKGSTAIENYHYNLSSNSVTIKAGEYAADVKVIGHYDNIEASDSIGTVLRIVAPEQVNWEMYGNETKIVFMKSCPFSTADFTADGGNFIFYATFPFSDSEVKRSLVKAEALPDGERIRFKALFGDADGRFDIVMRFRTDDPLEPEVEVLDQTGFYTANYGNVTVHTYDGAPNYYYSCQKFIHVYLTCELPEIGTFGTYQYILEWISQKDADYYARYGFPSTGLGM